MPSAYLRVSVGDTTAIVSREAQSNLYLFTTYFVVQIPFPETFDTNISSVIVSFLKESVVWLPYVKL